MKIRSYRELCRLETFEERFEYLKLNGSIGEDTFGSGRWLNQDFYKSDEWKRIRDEVIARDLGRDLGIPGRELNESVYIHHMNPITKDDILQHSDFLILPEFLICTSFTTHNAIHYGNRDSLIRDPVPRSKYDTCPWRASGKEERDDAQHFG